MKLTPDDIPCLVQSKYLRLSKKQAQELTTPDDADELFDSVDDYEEILIGGGDANGKLEFNLARFKFIKDLEFTTMPDGDFYFQKFKSKDGDTMFHLVKIYSVISRIPRLPNCVETLMHCSIKELETDATRLKLNDFRKTHKWLVGQIINWYFEFTYERLNNIKIFRDLDMDYTYNDETIKLYPNLIAEIQGF